jgi:hypothetical protein
MLGIRFNKMNGCPCSPPSPPGDTDLLKGNQEFKDLHSCCTWTATDDTEFKTAVLCPMTPGGVHAFLQVSSSAQTAHADND